MGSITRRSGACRLRPVCGDSVLVSVVMGSFSLVLVRTFLAGCGLYTGLLVGMGVPMSPTFGALGLIGSISFGVVGTRCGWM